MPQGLILEDTAWDLEEIAAVSRLCDIWTRFIYYINAFATDAYLFEFSKVNTYNNGRMKSFQKF